MTESGRKQLVVVGAGPAGCAAALEAAGLGLDVLLVDEHPQSAAAMSLDAPYFYGARFSPLLANPRAIAERMLSENRELAACVDAGVEVLTGTTAWGVFMPGPTSRHLGASQIGLADDRQSWCVAFDNLIVAAGARDLVLSFPGWQLPGVLGVRGAAKLLADYQAFDGCRLLVLGSGNAGLAFARQAMDLGLTIAGVVEPTSAILGDAALARSLADAGVPFYLGHTIERALGTHEVEAARLVGLARDGGAGATHDVACDTIVMAFGVVPNIELAAVAGCPLAYDASRGGWVPGTGPASNIPGVFIAGDAGGVTEAMLLDPSIAADQGRRAVRTIVGGTTECRTDAINSAANTPPAVFPPSVWIDSLVEAGGLDVVVCQCEEVTRRELLELQPPRYLGVRGDPPRETIRTAIADGRISQDLVKRMTRVGMGHCQGKRCRDHAALLIARAAGVPLADVVPGSYRAPVRPLSLAVMQAHDEPPELRTRWANWLHPVDGPPSGL